MGRSRPPSDPISFHGPTGQYYVTRGGRRTFLGTDRAEAIQAYHRLALRAAPVERPQSTVPLTAKELANRFIAAQQANWRCGSTTIRGYENWFGRFLADHARLRADEFTVEMFAAWKLSLRCREYAPASINHFLKAVRAMFAFAEESELLERVPKLRRVKNENRHPVSSGDRPPYSKEQLKQLLDDAGSQLHLMILLGLNCGFGPKDLQDLAWTNIADDRVTLPRSKTGIWQTFQLWPETVEVINRLRADRKALVQRLAKRERQRTDGGCVFITKYWHPWSKDAIAGEFRKLCKKVGVPCHGFYRLRHCASTAMSLVATPHVHRKFMRHSQLQQQVTYTHTPDAEVDAALMRAREKLLMVEKKRLEVSGVAGSDPQQVGAA